jgi:DNA-binding PadR family transcriptional regulator
MPPPSPLRSIDLFVLAVLADGPQHGYALAREIEARSGGRVHTRAADLYRVLYRLTDAQLIEEAPSRAAADERRTIYRITSHGRRVAREQAEILTGVVRPMLARRQKPEAAG